MRHEFKGRQFEEITLWAVRWYCKSANWKKSRNLAWRRDLHYGKAIAALKPGQVSGQNGASTDQISQQCNRVRPREAQTSDQAHTQIQIDETAYVTIRGFEVMHALRKGHAKLWMLSSGVRGEVRLVERAFGLGPSIMTEMMRHLETTLA